MISRIYVHENRFCKPIAFNNPMKTFFEYARHNLKTVIISH